jgi:hypothetical protein
MNYYIDPVDGDDGNPGTQLLPWKSISHTNAAIYTTPLVGGDQLLFKSGLTCNSAVGIDLETANCIGTYNNPVVIGMYGGTSKATINVDDSDPLTYWPKSAVSLWTGVSYVKIENIIGYTAVESYGSKSTMRLYHCHDIEISNCELHEPLAGGKAIEITCNSAILNFNVHETTLVGPGVGVTGTGDEQCMGIGVWTDSGVTNSGVTITNCTISGFYTGIRVGASASAGNWSDVDITGTVIHDCYGNGVQFWSTDYPTTPAVDGFNIVGCTVYNITGDVPLVLYGFGIAVSAASNGLVDLCVAYNLGDTNVAVAPCGIYAYCSDHVIFRRCEAYNIRSSTAGEGGGFQFDSGCQDCLCEMCYAHECDSYGFTTNYFTATPINSGRATARNTFQYNIGKDVAQKWSGGINAANSDGVASKSIDMRFYNNTIYVSLGLYPRALDFTSNSQNLVVKNNIFIQGKGDQIVSGNIVLASMTNPTFDGNLYYLGLWDSGTSTLYDNFATYQAAIGGEAHGIGFLTDPQLTNIAGAGTIGDGSLLASLAEYFRPLVGSPVINTGVDVSLTKDFMNYKIFGVPNIGAVESLKKKILPQMYL